MEAHSPRFYLRVLAVWLAVMAVGETVEAKIVHVTLSGNDASTGLSWATSKRSVQAGLSVAVAGDEVWVAAGTYVERIALADGVALYGGFTGQEPQDFDLSERDVSYHATILDGNASGSVVTAPAQLTASARIDGFTIRNGSGTLSNSQYFGGGIHCSASSVVISNNIITGNACLGPAGTVGGGGGGIYCVGCSPTISNCNITNNRTTGAGGGVYFDTASPRILNSTISENTARDHGGIYCRSGAPVIAGDTIARNTAQFGGGGVGEYNSTAIIRNNRFIENVTLSAGGAVSCGSGAVVIANNIMTGNGAHQGGGIYVSGSATIINNTITANCAAEAGGVYCMFIPDAVIANNIVAFNSSGIYKYGVDSARLTDNCVYNPSGYDYSGPLQVEHSLSSDPQLVAVAYGEIHLGASSSCINAGQATTVPRDWTDIDGQARIQGGSVDIGADEFDGSAPVFTPMIVRVSPAGNDDQDGSGWGAAKRTVQAGIDAVARSVGGEVWVAAGRYNEQITLRPHVHVYGGFAGNESGRGQRNWETRTTILEGGGGGSVVSSSHSAFGENTLDGFTIRSGTGTIPAGGVACGGGVYCYRSSPLIAHNTITGNNAVKGGGIYCDTCAPLMQSNTIRNNTSSGDGGGIAGNNAWPILTGNTIEGNIATGYGGGIYGYASSARVSGNTITGNKASADGGGLYLKESPPAVLPTIANNKFSGNTAQGNGGGIGFYRSWVAIYNNTLIGNEAHGEPGGGGGVFCEASAHGELCNNTLVGNSASGQSDGGGGIWCRASSMVINNTILAFNSSGYNQSDNGGAAFYHCCVYNPGGYNMKGGWLGLDVNFIADPGLADYSYGGLHLKAGSRCIDAGLNDAVKPDWVDMDGEARRQGAHVDIGADEFNGSPPTFTPKIVRVSKTGSDANDGATWASAKRGISTGIEAVKDSGGEVWVAAGVYNERMGLKPWAHVYGGFAGHETNREQRDWITNPTIIDGGGGGSVVISVVPGYAWSTIDGFTIRNGTGMPTDQNRSGGGIYCEGSSPTIANNLITGNSADGRYGSGGGIICIRSSPIILHNTISGNHINATNGYGGGILCDHSAPIIAGNTITGNNITSTNAYGGGIGCIYATPTITGNTITGNTTNSVNVTYGGGIYCVSCAPTISGNKIIGNSTTSKYSRGGGICCAGDMPSIYNNFIKANVASGTFAYGAGVYTYRATAKICNNTIVENQATGNSAYGGGICCDESSPKLDNNIVAFNSSGVQRITSGSPTLQHNCVFNPGGDNYSGVTAGPDNITVDPLFANAPAGDYRLSSGSPCIDAGYFSALPSEATTDFGGSPRVMDDPVTPNCQWAPGTCSTQFPVDIGAFEYVPAIPGDFNRDGFVGMEEMKALRACVGGPAVAYGEGCAASDLDGDGDVDLSDFGIFQRCFSGSEQPARPGCGG